ncbi:hypothetical protein J1614_000863 [Plenodomus biglobosus]|nr:hypothetical protein J1614_000863 [Plenodomus biglobosus]
MKLTTASCLVALAAQTLATPTPSPNHQRSKFNWKSIKSVIAFGDSYTYVQGTLGRGNYTYIGDAFNLTFSPSKLFSNRIVQNQIGTAAGGPNWVEYLTGCGIAPGLHDPQACKTQLWDFAYAGANTVSQANFTPAHWNHTVSFAQQIQQFADDGNPALESICLDKKDALVAVWIGINDIIDLALLRGKNATFTPLYETVQTLVFDNMEKVYELGYKKFLFVNLPPLDRAPTAYVDAQMVDSFNAIHAAHATAWQAKHKDATVLQYDVNTVWNEVLDNYKDYGFANVTAECAGWNQPDIHANPEKYGCGAGLDTYFWYVAGHPGSRAHRVFTKRLVKWLRKQK